MLKAVEVEAALPAKGKFNSVAPTARLNVAVPPAIAFNRKVPPMEFRVVGNTATI